MNIFKSVAIALSYLLIISVSGLISAYATGQSSAAPVELVGNEGLSIDPPDAKLFDIDNMYPGKTVTSDLVVKNEGADPFGLNIGLEVNGDFELVDSLELTVAGSEKEYYSGRVADLGLLSIGNLNTGSEKKLTFTLTFLPGYGNVTQNQSADLAWTFAAQGAGEGGGGGTDNGEPPGPVIPTTTDPGTQPFTPPADQEGDPAEPAVVPVAAPAVVQPEAPTGEAPPAEPTEEIALTPEAPQVAPAEQGRLDFVSLWPLWILLLLIPLLLLFLLTRMVLVMVPDRDGNYKTVARRFAGRRDGTWYVNIEKQLENYLPRHGLVVLDFRGALLKKAVKSAYSGQTILGTGNLRYALIGNRRMVTWASRLYARASGKVV